MTEEQLKRRNALVLKMGTDDTVYEDSSTFDVLKDKYSKTAVGSLFGFGSPDDRKGNDYGTNKGFMGGIFDAPRTLNLDGQRYGTANKDFNDVEQAEMQEYFKQNVKPSKNPNADHLYILENQKTGQKKIGTAKHGVLDRYKDDTGIEGWTTLYDAPTDNAKEIEIFFHGSKAARQNRAYSYGKSDISGLKSGGSEVYNKDVLDATALQLESVMSRKTRDMTKELMRVASNKEIKHIAKESDLVMDEDFYYDSKKVLESFGHNLSGMSPKEVNELMTDEIRGFDWNLADTAQIVTDLYKSDKETAQAFRRNLDKYSKTDTTFKQVAQGVGEIISDPTTYMTLGAGKAATLGAKSAIKKGIQIGALEGLLYASTDDVLRQQVDIIGKDKDYDPLQTGLSGLFGAALGGTIGGTVEAAPILYRKIKGPKYSKAEYARQTKPTKPTKPGKEDTPVRPDVKLEPVPEDIKPTVVEPKDNPTEFQKTIDTKITKMSSKQLENAIGRYGQLVNSEDATELQRKVLARYQEELDLRQPTTKIEDIQEVDSFKDDRLAQTDKYGRVQVRKGITKPEVQKYVLGVGDDKASIQKQQTNQYMKETYNIDMNQVVEDMTEKQAVEFVKRNLIAKNAQDKFLKTKGTSLIQQSKLNPTEAIKLEANANKRALSSMGLLKTSKTQYEKTIKESSKQQKLQIDPVIRQDEVVPENPIQKFDYPYTITLKGGVNGRFYTQDEPMTHQHGASTAASQKSNPTFEYNSIKDEVMDMLSNYDTDPRLRREFGEANKIGSQNRKLTKNEMQNKRFAFAKTQFEHLINSSSNKYSRGQRVEAREVLSEMKKKKLNQVPTEAEHKVTKKQYEDQFSSKMEADDIKARDKELTRQYKEHTKVKQEAIEVTPEDLTKGIFKQLPTKTEMIEATNRIEERTKTLLDPFKPTEKQKKLKDDLNIVQDYYGGTQDVKDLATGKLSPIEARYRAKVRLDDFLDASRRSLIDDKGELTPTQVRNMQLAEQAKYSEIGVKVIDTETKTKLNKDDSGTTGNITGISEPKEIVEQIPIIKPTTINSRSSLLKHLTSYKANTKEVPLNTSDKSNRRGRYALTDSQMKLVDEGVPFNEIADLTYPLVKTTFETERELVDIAKAQAIKTINDNRRLQTQTNDWSSDKATKIVHTEHVIDDANSLMQHLGILLKSKDVWNKFKTVREDIGAKIETMIGYKPEILDEMGEVKTWKDLVKATFMKRVYGEGREGAIRGLQNEHQWSKELATDFYDKYSAAELKVFPEIKQIEQLFERVKKLGNPNLKIELPNGFQLNLDMRKKGVTSYKVKGKQVETPIRIEEYDTLSSALIPNLIHMTDAYKLEKMARRGWKTGTHDSFQVPVDKTEAFLKDTDDVMIELLDENLLDSYLRQLGLDKEADSLPAGTLTKENIIASTTKTDIEHTAKQEEAPKIRSKEDNKVFSKEDIMRQFMAKDNYLPFKTDQLIKVMSTMASRSSAFSKIYKGQDVFERQLANAFYGSDYSKLKSVNAPKYFNTKQADLWNKEQRVIFDEFRKELESHPNLIHHLKGERKYFDKKMKPTWRNEETYADVAQRNIGYFKNQVKKIPGAEKESLFKIGSNYEEIASKVYSFKTPEQLDKANQTLTEAAIIAKKQIFMANKSPISPMTQKELESAVRYFQGDHEVGANVTPTTFKPDFKPDTILKPGTTSKQGTQGSKSTNNASNTNNASTSKTKDPIFTKSNIKQEWGSTKSFIKDQWELSEKGRLFIRMFNQRRNTDTEINKQAEIIQTELKRLIPAQDRTDWTKYVLNTDAFAIRHRTQEQANKFAEEWNDLYVELKQHIDAASYALNKKENQTGAYLNNANLIVTHYNKDSKLAPIVDQLISIKAMTPEAWKFIEKQKGTEAWDTAMGMIKQERQQAVAIMYHNPEAMIKGYTNEAYLGNKEIITEVSETGSKSKIQYNASNKYEAGVIPNRKENKRVGRANINKDMASPLDFKDNQQAMIDYALQYNFKITNSGFRHISDAYSRDKAGRSHDFVEILTSTLRATDEKIQHRKLASDYIDYAFEDNKLFSDVQIKGFSPISEEDTKALPFSLQSKIHFIDNNYRDRILGRNETRAVVNEKNHISQVIDRTVQDLVGQYKQNVVLKNISSFKNSILVGITTNLAHGNDPITIAKYMEQGRSEFYANKRLKKELYLLKAHGKPTERVQAKLDKSSLYRMEQAGLATNQLDGLRTKSTLLNAMLSDITGGKLDKIFNDTMNANSNPEGGAAVTRRDSEYQPSTASHDSEYPTRSNGNHKIQETLDTIANTINLSQQHYIGKNTTEIFSLFDTISRFASAMHFKSKGMSDFDAAYKANTVYSDMDQMAPVVIEFMDKYPIGPFAKWFSLYAPGMLKVSKDNWKKALLLGISLYSLSMVFDTDFSSINPVEALVDFGSDLFITEYLTKQGSDENASNLVPSIMNELTPYVIPSVYKDAEYLFTNTGNPLYLKGYKKSDKDKGPLYPLVKPRRKQYRSFDSRGVSQQAIDSLMN